METATPPDWITPAWLTGVIGADDNSVQSVELAPLGVGVGFAATMYRAQLSWENPGSEVPGSVVIKLPVQHDGTLDAVRHLGLFREVWFYERLANKTPVSTPHIYLAETRGDEYVLVMEDLGDFARLDVDLSVAEARMAIVEIARLHATYWNHSITGEDWLQPVADSTDEQRDEQEAALDKSVALMEAEATPPIKTIEIARKLQTLMPKAPKRIPLPNPVTLAHGDFHGNNLCFRDDGVVVFDWQLIAKGTPAMDVANLLFTSMSVSEYDKHIDELLHAYHDELLRQGVEGYTFKKFMMATATPRFSRS